jgi:SAM-dependent methyltransferase
MFTDIVDLREFYQTPLGHYAQRLLQQRTRQIWPNLRGERVLALGYATPLLRPWLGEAAALLAMMPAAQGVAYWPREGPNISSLVETDKLPLPDGAVDRVVVLHALEGAADPHGMLREIWRVMKSGARLLMIVPNRRGFWAHSDRTPFGNGQPYSAGQIRALLREQGFLIERTWHALYAPPAGSRLALSLADMAEKYGSALFPGLGGLLLVEAGKQLYAPIQTKGQGARFRLLLPLPLPEAKPAPAG